MTDIAAMAQGLINSNDHVCTIVCPSPEEAFTKAGYPFGDQDCSACNTSFIIWLRGID